MFRQDIIKELSEPNNYYDRCYSCNKLDTDGWGDQLCSECQAEFNEDLELAQV